MPREKTNKNYRTFSLARLRGEKQREREDFNKQRAK